MNFIQSSVYALHVFTHAFLMELNVYKGQILGGGCVKTEQDPDLEKIVLHKLPCPLACDLIGFIFFPKVPQKYSHKDQIFSADKKAELTQYY